MLYCVIFLISHDYSAFFEVESKFAKKYNFDIKFFDETQINSLEGEFSSSQAKKFFGLKGVAEPSSVLVSKYKELIIPKEVYEKKITIAGAV